MAATTTGSNRRERESDSMEALKPLVVLALFGMILYGAYSVVQKGPESPAPAADTTGLADAPPFAPPDARASAPPPGAAPTAGRMDPGQMPATPPPPAPPGPQGTVYLAAESAPLPTGDEIPPRAAGPTPPERREQSPSASAAPPPPPGARPAAESPAPITATPPANGGAASVTAAGGASSAAFASAWTDAHDKLAAGRYAEALAALSVWYDDPALGLEESQQLEDLLGQLAGTVIYSQQDLLLPPHVAAPGETLAAVAGPLGVSPELLAKINGVEDPRRLVPGEHLKVIRGPFDAVVSVSRRRISLQLNGAYAGHFPVVVGRRYMDKVGASLPVVEVQRGGAAAAPIPVGTASLRKAIMLGEGLVIEGMDDPTAAADAVPPTSLVMSARDLDEMLDIIGTASRVLVRQ